MAGVNKVTLVGNLGKDPEIRNLHSGGRVASLSLATSESWKDRSTGERKERTEWHKVVIWNDNLVGVVERFVRKGSKIYVEGQLETRKWTDNAGVDRYVTEVVLRQYRGEIVLLDSANANGAGRDQGGRDREGYGYGDRPGAGQSYGGGGEGYGGGAGRRPPADDLDDEIPFVVPFDFEKKAIL